MSKDYQALQDELSKDMSAAATSAALASTTGAEQKVLIRKSELKSVVPDNSLVTIQSVVLGKLAMGDIIIVGLDDGPQLRRFVRLKIRNNDSLLLTAYEGYGKKQALPKSCLIGRVVAVEKNGKNWDPTKENPLKKFWNRLTEFGTHKPFGIG